MKKVWKTIAWIKKKKKNDIRKTFHREKVKLIKLGKHMLETVKMDN